jgi:hypothetical protein
MKFSYRSFACVATISLISGSAAWAESLPIRPLPAPTIAPGPPLVEGPKATIAFADATQVTTQAGTSGRFQLVGLCPREVIDITFDFPVTLAGAPVTAQPLDGGKILGPSKDAGKGAKAGLIRFQVGDQPGLYRVLISGGGPASTLQFWVADAKKPKNNRPVINPGH